MQLTTAVITNLQITVAMSHLPKGHENDDGLQLKVTYFLSVYYQYAKDIKLYVRLTSQSVLAT